MIDAAELLHDPVALRAADGAGLLPAAGTVGAQVRALAEPLAALPAADRPRALVVVGAGAHLVGALLSALPGGLATVPVVAAAQLPGWVGPLDVVLVLAAVRSDPQAQQAAAQATRRGATVLLRADAVLLAEVPRVHPVPAAPAASEALALTARWALAVAVARWCGALPPAPAGADAAAQLEDWAGVLDAVALACHPSTDGFVNPAITVADHLLTSTPLLLGADPVGDVLAAAAAEQLGTLAGTVAGVIDHRAAALSPAVLRRHGAPRDIFADPDDGATVSVTVLQGPAPLGDPRNQGAGLLGAALPGALVLPADPFAGRVTDRSPDLGPVDPVAELLAAVLRWSFTAVYLGLTAPEQPVPLDHPDGLGRVGTALGAVREVPRWTPRSDDPDDADDELG